MSIIMVIIFILTGAYPLSMLLAIFAISGGGVNQIKGWSYFVCYWSSIVILSTPFIAIEYARS